MNSRSSSRSSIELRMKALQIAQKLRLEPTKFGPSSSVPQSSSTAVLDYRTKITNMFISPERRVLSETTNIAEEKWNVIGKVPKPSVKGDIAVPAKPLLVKKDLEQHKGPVPNPSDLRIFVKNLNSRTTEERLKSYFSRWGVVSDVCIRQPEVNYYREQTNMAFITFASYYKESPINIPVHVIDGNSVPIHLIGTLPNARHPLVKKSNSVMVTGAIHRCADSDLIQAFCKFGKIIKVTRKRDPDHPQQYLRYAFIIFNDTLSVDNAIEKAQMIKVCGQVVDVRRVKNQ